MKNIKNIFILLVVALVGLQLTACSDDDYNTDPYSKSGVNLLAFGPTPILRNTELRITGTNLDKVDKVVFPQNAEVEKSAFNRYDKENIYVTIPDETVPGNIRLVVGNDTIVSEGILTYEEPIEVTSVSPIAGLNAGDEIVIRGDYVYNIASVTFTNAVVVTAEEFTYVSRREVRLNVPLAAETGVITFSDGADWTEDYKDKIEIISATYQTVTSSADFGEQIQITGNNLHTVETVIFAGGVQADFTVSADHKTITTTIPADAKSGPLSLILYSGAALTTDDVLVPTVVINSASQATDLVEGDVVTLTGENFDRIVEMTLPGIDGVFTEGNGYTISGNTLTFTVPEGMTDGDVVLKQNANISATFALEMRKLFGVIWQGKENLSGWSNWGVFNWDGDKWTKFQEAISGAGELTFHFVATSDEPVFNLRLGDWSTPFSNISFPYESDGNIKPGKDATDIVIQLTAEEREKMFADGGLGMVIWGDGIQLQYIKFVAAGAELVLWEGNEDMAGWGNNFTIGTDTSPELAALNPHEGSIVRFYGVSTGDADNEWQVKIEEGHWGGTYASFAATEHDEFVGWDLEANGGCVKMTLTQAMLDAAYSQQWWGGTFIVHGQNFILTKVTVADL